MCDQLGTLVVQQLHLWACSCHGVLAAYSCCLQAPTTHPPTGQPPTSAPSSSSSNTGNFGGCFEAPVGSCHVSGLPKSHECSPSTPTSPPSSVHTATLQSLLPVRISTWLFLRPLGVAPVISLSTPLLLGRAGMRSTLAMAPSCALQWALWCRQQRQCDEGVRNRVQTP